MNHLGPYFAGLLEQYHQPHHLGSDPLEFVTRYQDPWDQEVVALVSAVLAYGNVTQIRKSVAEILSRLGPRPAEWVRRLHAPEAWTRAEKDWKDWKHRFNTGRDLVALLRLVERSWRTFGSVGAHFLSYVGPKDLTIEHGLNGLMRDWRTGSKDLGRLDRGFSYLMTSPEHGSTCKRWLMLLRWMGRKDAIDPGLWREGEPLVVGHSGLRASQLVMPLDTHTARLSSYLGLRTRKSLDWKSALEVTEKLRVWNPDDPVQIDFALARLGILDRCQRRFRVEICRNCDLLPVCRFARARRINRTPAGSRSVSAASRS